MENNISDMLTMNAYGRKEARMKTCIGCARWSDFDGCCWCAVSPRYLQEVDGYTPACEEFKPEEEQEDEDE